MEIPDNKQLIFEATIREFDLARIKTGQTAVLTLDAFEGSKIDARVKLVNTLANENTESKVNRFSVLLEIPSTIDNGHAGMYGQADILVREVSNKIVVPINFIQTDETNHWVWRDNQHSEKTNVKIGFRNHQWAEITSGLKLNETINL
jgi:multidrug efflux pump subunit AcrA (membrane-fusion protein)